MTTPAFIWPALAIALALISVGADSILKLSADSSGKSFLFLFIASFLIYGSTVFGWFFVIKHVKLSMLGVYYSVSTVLFLTIVSVLFFKEKVSPSEILGIILAVTSILLLSRFS